MAITRPPPALASLATPRLTALIQILQTYRAVSVEMLRWSNAEVLQVVGMGLANERTVDGIPLLVPGESFRSYGDPAPELVGRNALDASITVDYALRMVTGSADLDGVSILGSRSRYHVRQRWLIVEHDGIRIAIWISSQPPKTKCFRRRLRSLHEADTDDSISRVLVYVPPQVVGRLRRSLRTEIEAGLCDIQPLDWSHLRRDPLQTVGLTPALIARTSDLPQQVAADRHVGIGTLCRRYGITRDDVLALLLHYGLHTSIIYVEGRRHRPSTNRGYVVAHPRPHRHIQHDPLAAHDAALAELRLILGAGVTGWEHAYRDTAGDTAVIPDIYWTLPGGRQFDIEYDRGTYGPSVRAAKLRHSIQRCRPMIWASPNPSRLVAVQAEAAAIEHELAEQRAATGAAYIPASMEVRLEPVYWYVDSEANP